MTIIFKKRHTGVAPATREITLRDVRFAYAGDAVFTGLTATIPAGAITAVAGPNGCGKSTLLSLVAGVIRPAHGHIENGDGRDIAFAVQRSRVTDSFPITVAEAVTMGRWHHLGLLRRPSLRDREIVEHWLSALGLQSLRHQALGELSGGQRQRVLLAQAFAQESSVLLLDEPTVGLDAATVATVKQQLRELASAGTTVVMATHDSAAVTEAHHRITLPQHPRL